MKVEVLSLEGVLLLIPPRFDDSRGFFSETYNATTWAGIGITAPFVQDNHSLSRHSGVVRGLHCQVAPCPQGKLVRCSRGAIWDVAVDVRTGSPTFGQWAAATLSAENGSQLWIPPGFLHGFCTLRENTEVQYKCTGPWDRACERVVRWNDETLGIEWPISDTQAILSPRDEQAPAFSSVIDWFQWP
ncbi:dTDP-4-dehydrorhamnose 3,5-epimerase [Komagataeibacter kakiaceti JCM 25156]